jgi:signal transduction histidine kinase
LGHYLIDKGILQPEDLERALSSQAKSERMGNTKLIGQTLLDLGLVSKQELDQAITEQIIELQSALQKANAELEERIQQRTFELERALSRLSELNQLKSNFISNISHELRTPLTHIRGYMELLVENELGPLTQEQANALEVMRKSEARLEHLIEDLIQFSLVSSRGKLDLHISTFDIPTELDGILADARQKCRNASLDFQFNASKSLPFVRADPSKIRWVVGQLLDNAVKFTPEGGRIGVRISPAKDRVKVAVSDTGIGISEAHLQEIFEPFHQLDGSSTRRYGGTGLGLSLAQQIIQAHGALIKVDSHPGKGSRFEFSLPIARGTPYWE